MRIVVVGCVTAALLSGCGSASSGKAKSGSTAAKTASHTPESEPLSRAAMLRGRLQHSGYTVEPGRYHAASSVGESTPAYAALEVVKGSAVPVQVWVFASDQDAEGVAAKFGRLDSQNPGHGALRRVGADFYIQTSSEAGTVSQAAVDGAAAAAEATTIAAIEAGTASGSSEPQTSGSAEAAAGTRAALCTEIPVEIAVLGEDVRQLSRTPASHGKQAKAIEGVEHLRGKLHELGAMSSAEQRTQLESGREALLKLHGAVAALAAGDVEVENAEVVGFDGAMVQLHEHLTAICR